MRLHTIERFTMTILEGKVIKFYKTIFPMMAILSLVTPMVLILSLVGRANASSLHGLVGAIVTNSIPEPFTLILLGIGLIGLARIIRKKFVINKSTA